MAIDLSGGLPVEREYVLPECPDQPDIRDAVNVWIEEKDAKFGMRIGIEATSPTWDKHMVWLDIAFADGRVMSLRTDNAPTHPAIGPEGLPTIRGAGPLTFRLVEPFKRSTQLMIAEADNQVVGTLQFNWGGECGFTEEEMHIYRIADFLPVVGPEGIIIFSRYMTRPDHRTGPLPGDMLDTMYRFALEKG